MDTILADWAFGLMQSILDFVKENYYDFYIRMRASNEGLRFILKHWYEIPGMLPLFVFSLIESYTVIGAAARSIRLIRLFRLIHLFFRSTTIFAHTKFLYLIIFTRSE